MSLQEPMAQINWLEGEGQLTPEAHILLLQMVRAANAAMQDITSLEGQTASLEAQIVALEARVTALEP